MCNIMWLHPHSMLISLQWRQNERDDVANHQHHDCLLNRSSKVQIEENMKAPRHWPLWGEFTGNRWFPAEMASNAEMFPFDDVIMILCLYPHSMLIYMIHVPMILKGVGKIMLETNKKQIIQGRTICIFLAMWIMTTLWIKYMIITPFWGRLQFIAAQT